MTRALAIVLLVALAAPARADTREDARREFAAGEDADKHKDWRGALEHYLRANDLVPHPFAMFNIARDYEQLGQLREAAKWYERYLGAATDSPDRAKVQRLLDGLRSRPSKIVVRASPDGARVIIDNVFDGTTPYAGVVRGGVHRVIVEQRGQHDQRDVPAEFGEPVDVSFQLAGETGTLVVTGPAGALVLVDGMSAGVVPARVDVAPGPHTVHVQAVGYQPFDAQPIVTPGRIARVDAPAIRGGDDTGTPNRPKLALSYILALAGGADARTIDGIVLVGFGARISRFDLMLYLGRDNGGTAYEFVGRWMFLDKRVTPFLAAGYAYETNGTGFQATAGLRFDVSRGGALGLSLLVESGVHFTSGTDSMGNATTTLEVPILASIELLYGKMGP